MPIGMDFYRFPFHFFSVFDFLAAAAVNAIAMNSKHEATVSSQSNPVNLNRASEQLAVPIPIPIASDSNSKSPESATATVMAMATAAGAPTSIDLTCLDDYDEAALNNILNLLEENDSGIGSRKNFFYL